MRGGDACDGGAGGAGLRPATELLPGRLPYDGADGTLAPVPPGNYIMPRPQPILTVDAVLLTLEDGQLKVALHERTADPFKGIKALPGGFVHPEEDSCALDTAYRVLRQKTGFIPRHLEQLCVFSGPERDPRGWSVSIAFVALSPIDALRSSGSPVFSYARVDALPNWPSITGRSSPRQSSACAARRAIHPCPARCCPNASPSGSCRKSMNRCSGKRWTSPAFVARLTNWLS